MSSQGTKKPLAIPKSQQLCPLTVILCVCCFNSMIPWQLSVYHFSGVLDNIHVLDFPPQKACQLLQSSNNRVVTFNDCFLSLLTAIHTTKHIHICTMYHACFGVKLNIEWNNNICLMSGGRYWSQRDTIWVTYGAYINSIPLITSTTKELFFVCYKKCLVTEFSVGKPSL